MSNNLPTPEQHKMAKPSPNRVRYDDRTRTKHSSYVESAKKLERQLEEGFERTRKKLAEQREELQRRAWMRR
jgi:hypothetical protein